MAPTGTTDPGESDVELVEGQACQVRRHGRALLFVSLADSAGQLTFQMKHFVGGEDCEVDGLCDAFPSSKSSLKPGDTLKAWVRHVDGCKVVSSWKKLASPHSSEPGKNTSQSAIGGRRNGLAAASGWVACPLCPPSSPKRYNRRGGLEAHLEAIHIAYLHPSESSESSKKWAAILENADNMGIFMTRVAVGSKRNNPVPSDCGMEFKQCNNNKLLNPGLLAARDGSKETLSMLLDQGWDPLDAASLDRHGASALDWAAGNGHVECLELLLPRVGSRQVCRRDGRGPAHWAARCGQVAVLDRLLLREGFTGFHPDVPTGDGTTMLMLACFGGHLSTAQQLVSRFGASPFKVNGWGCDAGHFAAMGGHVEVCKWLKEVGLSLSRQQCKGHTALHKAAARGNGDVIQWILENEDVSAEEQRTDNKGSKRMPRSPLDLALQYGHSDCAELLRERGF